MFPSTTMFPSTIFQFKIKFPHMFPHIDHKCLAFCFQARRPPPLSLYSSPPKQPSPREEQKGMSQELCTQPKSDSPHDLWAPDTDDSSPSSLSSPGSSDPDDWHPIGRTQRSPLRVVPGADASQEHVTGEQPPPLHIAPGKENKRAAMADEDQ